MNEFAVTILYQKRTVSEVKSSLRLAIIEANNEDEALGKAIKQFKEKDEDLENMDIAIHLVLEIKADTDVVIENES